MEGRKFVESLNVDEKAMQACHMKDVAYFDIETTGFDKEEDCIILITLGRFLEDESFELTQYFADDLYDEQEMLERFRKDISQFDTWCSYNGLAFDEPFIVKRMQYHGLEFTPPLNHMDLYRCVKPYYRQLGMERCNLKTVEKYIGMDRADQIDGGQCVELYFEYLESGLETLKKAMLLHNFEDVLSLPKIHELVYKINTSNELERADLATEKQISYLDGLARKFKLELELDKEKLSKRQASRLIDAILKGCTNERQLQQMANREY